MIATFDALPRRAHGRKEIEKLLDKHRREWHLLAQTTSSDLIEYLQTLHLSVIDLTGEGHSQERVRYSWRDPTVFDGKPFPSPSTSRLCGPAQNAQPRHLAKTVSWKRHEQRPNQSTFTRRGCLAKTI